MGEIDNFLSTFKFIIKRSSVLNHLFLKSDGRILALPLVDRVPVWTEVEELNLGVSLRGHLAEDTSGDGVGSVHDD